VLEGAVGGEAAVLVDEAHVLPVGLDDVIMAGDAELPGFSGPALVGRQTRSPVLTVPG
jgi:hypothetical protein